MHAYDDTDSEESVYEAQIEEDSDNYSSHSDCIVKVARVRDMLNCTPVRPLHSPAIRRVVHLVVTDPGGNTNAKLLRL